MDLEEVLDEAGIPWPSRGRKIQCFKHVDKTPSLHLYDDDLGGHWYCFACGAYGLPGDLLYGLTGRWPERRGPRGVMDRTEQTAGLSTHAVRESVTSRKRALGARLTASARTSLPEQVRPTWLEYLGTVEGEIDDAVRELPPYEAGKMLDRWERVISHFEWLFAEVSASVTEWTSQTSHS